VRPAFELVDEFHGPEPARAGGFGSTGGEVTVKVYVVGAAGRTLPRQLLRERATTSCMRRATFASVEPFAADLAIVAVKAYGHAGRDRDVAPAALVPSRRRRS